MPKGHEVERRVRGQIIKMRDNLAHSVNHATPSQLAQQRILIQGKKDFLKAVIARNKRKEAEYKKK